MQRTLRARRTVITYADEEAIELANVTIHGLSGSVHSEDLAQVGRIADGVQAGTIHVDDQPINDGTAFPSTG